MIVVDTFATARAATTGTMGLVPTMGYLHEGHLVCADTVRGDADLVMMSIFVNPLQFNDADDLARYPRSLDRDVALAESGGVDIVFAPTLEEMYPETPLARVSVATVSEGMEGEYRPGHFGGVATAVTKLLAGLRPDRVAFGRKDAQQLAVLRRLVFDLSFPVTVVEVSTVREPDGLALSSRNVFVKGSLRPHSASPGLFAAADAVTKGSVRERSSKTWCAARRRQPEPSSSTPPSPTPRPHSASKPSTAPHSWRSPPGWVRSV